MFNFLELVLKVELGLNIGPGLKLELGLKFQGRDIDQSCMGLQFSTNCIYTI
jgi:hypothetical protein